MGKTSAGGAEKVPLKISNLLCFHGISVRKIQPYGADRTSGWDDVPEGYNVDDAQIDHARAGTSREQANRFRPFLRRASALRK